MLPVELLAECISSPEIRPSRIDEAKAEVHSWSVKLRRLSPSKDDAGTIYSAMLGVAKSWPVDLSSLAISDAVAWAVGDSPAIAVGGSDALRVQFAKEISGAIERVRLPWPMLDEASRPLMAGSICVIAGTPGAGKSWFVSAIALNLIRSGIRVASLALEEQLEWHQRRALAAISGESFVLDPEKVKARPDETRAIFDAHRDEIDRFSASLTARPCMRVLEIIEWAKKSMQDGCRVIIIDPITLANPAGMKPYEADALVMTRLGELVCKHNATCVLVSHPRKQIGRAFGPPSLDDLAGGTVIARACASALWISSLPRDCVVCAEREDGSHVVQPAHKSVRVIKSRNAPAHDGAAFAFTFHRLSFSEVGMICGDQK
jgi:KaiC/GvpD/RAD55 family RecA-like ATPase